jgi:NAD-dependent SIR2 family protein deacetylase
VDTLRAAPDTDRAVEVVAGGGVLVLTGAGISTDSGIPDYRGPGSTDRRPLSYQDFVTDPAARQRYWARSHVGWRRMARARPNAGHAAVAALESAGVVDAVVTQNVDRLHTAAGSRRVVELHGRIDEVVCLRCGAVTSGFRVADCAGCGGLLKPHLAFVGANVPRARVELCHCLVDRARALLVAGSSLTVFSGRRFVVLARRRRLPVVIVNRGPTRCDGDLVAGVDVRVEGGCAEVLGSLAERVGARPSAGPVPMDPVRGGR